VTGAIALIIFSFDYVGEIVDTVITITAIDLGEIYNHSPSKVGYFNLLKPLHSKDLVVRVASALQNWTCPILNRNDYKFNYTPGEMVKCGFV
jgi:hypothetical protein